MLRRFYFLLFILLGLNFLNLLRHYPSILGSTITVSASITTNSPPTINFVSPTDGQSNVPADANIVVEILDASYGVNLNTVNIIINGVTYTPSSPRVVTTGSSVDYTFTVTPYDPLYADQVNTVLVEAANLNGNSTQASITFNLQTSPTSTPPLSTPTPSLAITPTPIPLITKTPSGYCPQCPPCPNTLSPTSIANPSLSPTPTSAPDISLDKTSPIIEFISPLSKATINSKSDLIFKVSDSESGVDRSTVKITVNKKTYNLTNLELSSLGDASSYQFTLSDKALLQPDTQYQMSVFAVDQNNNGISKTIFFQTKKSFPYKVFYLIPLLVLIFFVYQLLSRHLINNKNNSTLGIIYNSLTLEPLPFITVKINNKKIISNIYGIIATKLTPGSHILSINNPDFAFPSTSKYQILDYPAPYKGQPFKISPDTNTFLNIPLDPYKDKSTLYKVTQKILPKFGTITAKNGEAKIGLKLGLIETKFNTIITSRITDSNGHYRFIVPHGRYNLVIFGTDTILKTIDTRHQVNGFTVINQNIVV